MSSNIYLDFIYFGKGESSIFDLANLSSSLKYLNPGILIFG